MKPALLPAVRSGLVRCGFMGLCCLMLIVSGQTQAQEAMASADAQLETEVQSDLDKVAQNWFERLDQNQDGQLSEAEFRAGFPSARLGVVYQRLSAKFRESDRNQSGFLEADEYAELPIIIHAGPDAPTLASVDSSHDDRLDFREYVAMVAVLDGAIP